MASTPAQSALLTVLAEPTRRRILDLLLERPRTVGDLVGELGATQPTTSKHLRVLREAGLVHVHPEAQRRVYALRPHRLAELDAWLAPYRRLWEGRLDALEQHLDDHPDAPREEHEMTATLETGDGRSTLRFERLLRHPRERVWRAVTDPAELERWFPTAVVYEPRVGAPMQFDFGGEHGLDVWPGEVLEWDPPRLFGFAWGEDVLRFELSDADAGTRLVFTHSFAHEAGKEVRDASGWAACLEAFEALLDGSESPPRGDWSAYEEQHAARFGALEVDGCRLQLQGPYLEIDGRAAVSARLGDQAGVLVVRDAGRGLADGAPVELRAGTVDEPGETLATGVLRDPLA